MTTTSVVVQNATLLQDSAEYANNFEANEVSMPYLLILQAMSPQVKKGPTKVDGAEEGDLYNSLTGELIEGAEGVDFIPCAYKKVFIEKTVDEKGIPADYVATHHVKESAGVVGKKKQGVDFLGNGNVLVEVAQYFGLLVKQGGGIERVAISMKGSQLKKSKTFNGIIASLMVNVDGKVFNPPMFSSSYKLKTEIESYETNTWYGWKIGGATPVNPQLYATAADFARSVRAGRAAVREEEIV